MQALEQARRHLDLYQPWKSDHVEAMLCRDFEDWLAEGVCVHNLIYPLFERMRRSVYSGGIPHEAVRSALQNTRQWFIDWLAVAEPALPVIAQGIGEFGAIDHAEVFQSLVRKSNEAVAFLQNPVRSLSPGNWDWPLSDEEAGAMQTLAQAKKGMPGTLTRDLKPMPEGDASWIQ